MAGKNRIVVALAALSCIILAACNMTPVPTATVTPSPEPTRTGWLSLQSDDIGVSFEFPPVTGEVSYEYMDWGEHEFDPAGIGVTWESTGSWNYAFAGCVSQDFKIGREGWPTDSIRWRQEGETYFVDFPLGNSLQVTPLRVVSHPAGVQGIIYDPNPSYWGDMAINPDKADRAAVLNLPAGYDPKIECLSFYFYDETPLDTIEAVLLSVKFTR
jgi:hypothetical protein